MIRICLLAVFVASATAPVYWMQTPARSTVDGEELWHHRNLGKAYYENPTTHPQAEEEFARAVALSGALRDHVNYGLTLLQVGKFDKAVEVLQHAEGLEKAQSLQGSRLLHIPFALGIAFKKRAEISDSAADRERAIAYLQAVIQVEPEEPMANYNLAMLLEEVDQNLGRALPRFEAAARHSDLPEPHYRLAGAYQRLDRAEDASRERQLWQRLKAAEAGTLPNPERIEWSFYREIYEPVESRQLAGAQSAPLQLQETDLGITVEAGTAGLAALDVDADGQTDLIAWSKQGIAVLNKGVELDRRSGLETLKDVVDVAPGDYNNDGLMDLCIVTKSQAALFVNVKGRFQADSVTLPGGAYSKAIWVNYDHDNDIDLLLFGEAPALLQNAGQSFADRSSDFPFVKGHATSATLFAADADKPASDVVVAYGNRPAVLYRDNLRGKYEAITLDSLPAGTRSLVAQDVDQDSLIDLIGTSPSGPLRLLNRNGKLDGPATPLPGSGVLTVADLRGNGTMDFITGGVAAAEVGADSQGHTHIVIAGADGRLRNVSSRGAESRWVEVSLNGVKNVKLAPGALVEVKAGGLYQKRVYNGTPLFFGLAGYSVIDTVRIQWPNGLFQNQIAQAAGKRYSYQEAQRLSGSCPMIFTWNGHEYEFITDVLGVAPLGASAGDGQYFPVDDDEYVQIRGESLVPIGGKYEIRITEELREVSYLDKVRLIALDHPQGIEIFTNDKFKAPPFPEFRLFGSRRRMYPVAASESGEKVLSRITARDRRYPDNYRRDYSGIAEMHYLDLNFGSAAPANRAVLVLNGWVDWADGSTFLGAAQEKNGELVLPYLQVKNSRDEWQTVIKDMGIPAGKPKTIAVDMAGLFLTDSREIRIVTNLCVYWDEIFLIENNDSPSTTLTEIKAGFADLRFRGFSKPTIDPQRKQPESFSYAQPLPSHAWNWDPTPGTYTRYGDVLPLINDDKPDDRLLIMGSGDELRLQFPTRNLPPLPAGWRRDFLLLVVGWAKDGDFNTAHSQTVEPLPFHGMSAYPYPKPEHFPDDTLHQDWAEQYNTRPALRVLHPLKTASR